MEEDNKEEKKAILSNIRTVVVAALSLSVALGFNDLVETIFNSFPNSHHIISKTTYLVIMFGITLLVAFWFFEINHYSKTKKERKINV
jgi:hypothetical protein